MSIRNKFGFSLVETLLVVGIASVIMLAMASMQKNQSLTNNFIEFQLKRTQLQGAILGQFLNDPANCQCLFRGASEFPVAGTSGLSGVNPTQIGRYQFVTPGNCNTATVPMPLVSNTGVDRVQTTSIRLRNIMNVSGAYSGNLIVNVRSMKDVLGPRDLPITIPVSLQVVPGSPGNVVFQSCSLLAAASSSPLPTIVTASPPCGQYPGGQSTVNCPGGLRPFSCNVFKLSSAGEEDSLMCRVNQATNSCTVFRDGSGGCDSNVTMQCHCL